MKVLHILNHSLPNIDGYSIRSINILRSQQERGIEVVALTSPKHEGPTLPIEVIQGITFHRTGCQEPKRGFLAIPFVKECWLMWKLRAKLLELVRSEKVDLLHAHSPSLNGIPARSVARQMGIPVVYEQRTLWEESPEGGPLTIFELVKKYIGRWLETNLLRSVDAVTVISEGLREVVVARLVSKSKVRVCPNGIDVAMFQPRLVNSELRRALGLEGLFVVGFIGSFRYWEGLDILLQSFTEVVKRSKEIRLLLVGQDEGDHFRRMADSMGIGREVVFAGRVAIQNIFDYYSIIDLCVYPRRRMRLTDCVTPLKPLEAMAMEKLVLGSDVGGHMELIHNGVDGLLFRADDPLDLADKITMVAAGPDQFDHLRYAARQAILARRNWKDLVTTYIDLYATLTGNAPPSQRQAGASTLCR